ncbi:MAG: hypothetical protein VKP72_07900 [bacterium]|nr:hypothetical protein [bacterium]
MSLSTWLGWRLKEVLEDLPHARPVLWTVVAPRAGELTAPADSPDQWRVIRSRVAPDDTLHLWICPIPACHEDENDGRA